MEAVEFATLEWVDWLNNHACSCPSATSRRLKRAHLLGLLGGPSHRSMKQAKQPPVFPGQFRKSGLWIAAAAFVVEALERLPKLGQGAVDRVLVVRQERLRLSPAAHGKHSLANASTCSLIPAALFSIGEK